MNVHVDPQTFAASDLSTPITVARGDGIGPEIMDAALRVLEAAGARLAIEEIQIGETVYRKGVSAGISPESWERLRRTGLLLKAPVTTPQGGGFKSLNVTIRKGLGLFANVRPCRAYAPFVVTQHPNMDLVVVRENEEDLYAGIEHRQTEEVYQCLKLISRPGTERIVRYAFEYARAHGRKTVTCFTKDNIMKMTDGLFHKVFDEMGEEYPDLVKNHMIIDIGAARIATHPERFDVIVTPNLYGDIISDIAAEVAGSVGLAGSANIGLHGAMFEAIHGSAPDIAGQGIANPSGLILSGVMLLRHIGQFEAARRIHHAWLKTIEDGIHTPDIYRPSLSSRRVSTQDFAGAVIARLGEEPAALKGPGNAAGLMTVAPPSYERKVPARKDLVGFDVFVEWNGTADALAAILKTVEDGLVSLKLITNRGVKVWPEGLPETFCTDHWRCRFEALPGKAPNKATLARLLCRLAALGVEFVKTEHLFTFDGVPGYSLGQGQ
jgi:isocitrate dehydrogenase